MISMRLKQISPATQHPQSAEFRLVARASVRKTRADFALPHNRHQIPGRKPRYLLSRCSTALLVAWVTPMERVGGPVIPLLSRIFAHISTPDTAVARLQGVRPYLHAVDTIVSFGCIGSVKLTERPELYGVILGGKWSKCQNGEVHRP
jgi:hypothetical protein